DEGDTPLASALPAWSRWRTAAFFIPGPPNRNLAICPSCTGGLKSDHEMNTAAPHAIAHDRSGNMLVSVLLSRMRKRRSAKRTAVCGPVGFSSNRQNFLGPSD